MGFNFGAFAGGLSQGIQAGQKMALEQKKYDSEVKAAEEKLKLEGQKLQQEVADREQKAKDRIADGMVKAEEVMAKDLPIENKLSMFNNISKAYGLGMAKTMISDPISGEKFVVDIPREHLSTIDSIQKDLDIYKNEGNSKLDNTGALYTRPNAESEFTPTGFKGTNAKAFTKEEKPKSSFGVINGKEGFYTEEQLANATAQGMSVERSKDKPAMTKVDVKIQQAQQDYSEAFDLGAKVVSGDKSIPLKDLAVAQSKVLSSDYGKTESVKNLEKDSAGLHKNIMSLKTLKKDIDAIADDPAFENQYKTAFNEVITKYVPENFYELSPSDKEATYQSLRAKGKMGDALAQYLKSNSGTAASEKEAIRNLTNMFGGENISLMSPKSIRNSLSGFIDTRIESAKVLAQDASDSGLPLNAKKLKDVIDTHTPPVNDYEKIAKEQGKVYDPANYEYSLINGVLKQRLIKKGN